MGHLRDILGGRKVVSVTMQTPQETLGSAVYLPTSEPATPQVSYTVASGDLPAFNVAPDSKKWMAYMIAAGSAVTAATLYWRMKKNGSSVANGSQAVTAAYYYTQHSYFYDVAVGDVLEIALWSSVTNTKYDYKAYQIQPTRVLPKNGAPILSPFNITTLTAYPTLTSGNPAVFSTVGFYVYHDDVQFLERSTTVSFRSLHPGLTYGLGRLYRGDMNYQNSGHVITGATYRPYYCKQYIPDGFVFRAMKI